jgi:hypothetical protein
MPDFQIDFGNVRPYAKIPLVSGYSSMPITFTPGPCETGGRGAFPVLKSPRIRAMD